MRRYESLIILDPDLPDEDIVGFTERYSQLIKTSGGEIIKIEDWGSKRLAYLVKKRDRGRYILIDFVGLPALITEMERQFKISEEVMKFLSVKLDDSVDLDAFKAAQEPPPEPEPQEAPPVEESDQPVTQEGAPAAEEAAVEEPVTTETGESEPSAAPTTEQTPEESAAAPTTEQAPEESAAATTTEQAPEESAAATTTEQAPEEPPAAATTEQPPAEPAADAEATPVEPASEDKKEGE